MAISFNKVVSHPAFRHTLIVLGLIALFVGGQKKIVNDAETIAEKWFEKIMVEDPNNTPVIPSSFEASDSEKERLLEQVRIIRGRA